MAERTTIVTSADVIARLSTQAYTRLFAKNGGNTVDTTFRDLCVTEANSRIRTWTRAAFPDGLYDDTDTLDPEAVGRACDVAYYLAAKNHPSADEGGAYAFNYREAREFFKALSRDKDERLPGSSTAPAQPRATIHNTTDAAGVPTNPYVRNASGQDQGGF